MAAPRGPFRGYPSGTRSGTSASERTLRYKADQFDQRGMLSLFPKVPDPPDETARSLPPPIRQAIVDLHAEHPALKLREIATICYVRFGRKPSHHTVQQILAAGPKPSITARRFPPYGQMADPFERRRALIILHAEGWTVTSIAAYMQTTRTRVYETLQRWAQEGFAGLDDKSHAPHQPHRKITFDVMQEIRKLQENPELGAFRMSAALEQMGHTLSPASCGRVVSLNRRLYGLDRPKGAVRPKKEMPFEARFRHEW